jgi:hypothetical protein
MKNPNTAHLNNLVAEQEGHGENGPIRTFKGTKANLAKVEAQASALQAGIEAPRCSGTVAKSELVESGESDYWGNPVRPIRREWQVKIGCGALLETQSGLCWDCLGRKVIDPGLVQKREFIALNRVLSAVEATELVDYTIKSNESVRYSEQAPGAELLKAITDSFTYVEKERRLDLKWGGKGDNWEGKASVVFLALGLPYGPNEAKSVEKGTHLPSYQDLAGLVASTSWRVAQNDANRLEQVGDLESYIWTALLARTGESHTWDLVRLEVNGAYQNWYHQLNRLRILSSDATGNAISLDRKAYDESDGGEEWLANDYDQRVNLWEQEEGEPLVNLNEWQSYIHAKEAVSHLLSALPEEIRDIVVKKADGVTLTATERKRLSRFLRGGPTKRRTSPDGRNTETPANAFQVQLILEGGLPAGRIVSWHKSQRT